MTLLIKNADLDGVTADVLVDDQVQQIGGARPAAATIDARGCAVIPGLHAITYTCMRLRLRAAR